MDRYAVIGNPVRHSLSPEIHRRFARQTGIVLSYEAVEAPLDGFVQVAQGFIDDGGLGFNVTVPFKEQAAAWVTRRDPLSERAAAVNTVALEADGTTAGYNTDGPGLVRDLERLLEGRRGLRVLLVGAGGAARGVVGPLLSGGVAAELVIANRNPARAEVLVADLAGQALGERAMARGLAEVGAGYDLVVNATAAGLDGTVPALDPQVVRGALCYDLVYGAETAFCRWARSAGARAVWDGLGMLVEQAALAFEIWRGIRPDTAPVLAALRHAGAA